MCNNDIVVDTFVVVDVNEEPLLGRHACSALNLVKRVEVHDLKVDEKVSFLTENKDVFKGFGGFVKDFNMELKEGSTGVIRNARLVPEALKGRLKSALETLCSKNVISKVNEPTDFVSNLNGSLRIEWLS